MVVASPKGRWFAVVYQHNQITLVDAVQGEFRQRGFTGQGNISAAQFRDDGTLLVTDRATRVTRYRLDPLQKADTHAPRLAMMEQAFYSLILPLYKILPKPAELNNTALYLLTGKESLASRASPSTHLSFRPWNPVWSGLAFVVVMLALACWYIERSEF